MKYTNTPLKLFTLLLLSLTACKGNSQNGKKPDTKPVAELQKTINTLTASLYKDKLDQLLTPEIAAAAVGKPVSQAKKTTNSIGIRYQYGQSGRTKKYKDLTYPATDFIELKFVQNYTLEKFKQQYHTPTEAEMKMADEAAKAKMAEMVKEGKATQQQASLAGSMASAFGKGLSFDEVPGVGEYAVWNNKDKQLNVFYKGIGFQLLVDAYADEATNKAKSVGAAKAIVQKLK